MATCNRNTQTNKQKAIYFIVCKRQIVIYTINNFFCARAVVVVVVGQMIKTNHYLRLSLIMYRRVLTMGSEPQLATKKSAMPSSHSHSIFPEPINRKIHGWDDFRRRSEPHAWATIDSLCHRWFTFWFGRRWQLLCNSHISIYHKEPHVSPEKKTRSKRTG